MTVARKEVLICGKCSNLLACPPSNTVFCQIPAWMDRAGQGDGLIVFLDRLGKKVVQMPKAQRLQISAMAKSFLCAFLKIGTRAQTW